MPHRATRDILLPRHTKEATGCKLGSRVGVPLLSSDRQTDNV